MAGFWLVLIGGLLTFFLGVFVWVFIQHLLTIEIPSTLKHPVKLWILHLIFQYLITLVSLPLGHTMNWWVLVVPYFFLLSSLSSFSRFS